MTLRILHQSSSQAVLHGAVDSGAGDAEQLGELPSGVLLGGVRLDQARLLLRFRPSQTQYATPLIEREARKAGYQTCVFCDVDSLDYAGPGPDAIASTVLGAVRPGSM